MTNLGSFDRAKSVAAKGAWGQIILVHVALPHIEENGSFTLVSGVYAWRHHQNHQNDPPNCPHTSVFLVIKLKFYTNICSVFKEIAEAASFGTRKSQVQILPPRPPSKKIGGIEFHRYDFWVGSWVGRSGGSC
jgi:hypothetical protein